MRQTHIYWSATEIKKELEYLSYTERPRELELFGMEETQVKTEQCVYIPDEDEVWKRQSWTLLSAAQ